MKITGLITEYNPFHNGHAYHIKQARALTNADYLIVIMSGNYVQRGEPAIIDKYTRTKMALLNGADLVLELPVCYSCASAEYFATGAVSLLDQLGVVDALCFGSECSDIRKLSEYAAILCEEPEPYRRSLKSALKEGFSFPAARAKALSDCFSQNDLTIDTPNNILGIEYLKALLRRRSSIRPYCITRIANDYHDESLVSKGGISSATALRKVLLEGDLTTLKTQMPESAFHLLSEHLTQKKPVTADLFSLLLHYALLYSDSQQLAGCLDVGKDLADRICHFQHDLTSFDRFVNLIKTKHLTETHIRRALFHIILSIKTEDICSYIENDWHAYIRLLGFKRTSSNLLWEIKKHSSLPMISKLADAKKLLSTAAFAMLSKDIRASELYESVVTHYSVSDSYNEYRKELVII